MIECFSFEFQNNHNDRSFKYWDLAKKRRKKVNFAYIIFKRFHMILE